MSMTRTSSKYFERSARNWDAMRSEYFDDAVRDAAIAHSYLRPDMIVADVGAGTGFVAGGLAPLGGIDVAVELDLTVLVHRVQHPTTGGDDGGVP